MSVPEQLVFDLDAPPPDTNPVLSRHVPAGPARLLRALMRAGMSEEHLRAAALLVLELDAGAGR